MPCSRWAVLRADLAGATRTGLSHDANSSAPNSARTVRAIGPSTATYLQAPDMMMDGCNDAPSRSIASSTTPASGPGLSAISPSQARLACPRPRPSVCGAAANLMCGSPREIAYEQQSPRSDVRPTTRTSGLTQPSACPPSLELQRSPEWNGATKDECDRAAGPRRDAGPSGRHHQLVGAGTAASPCGPGPTLSVCSSRPLGEITATWPFP